ncbi:MAG TPA: trehalase-like domain-containing protein [Streptosporangiaceae bacterium]|nr:trehalase-like domain-containing protein [Streptosporangiaceae bacterium]
MTPWTIPALHDAPSPYPPIADYAFLSDCGVTVLVAPSGSVEWMCLPRLDGPSVFGALLDRDAGWFRLGPTDRAVPADRRYLAGTMVLERPPTDYDAEHILPRTVRCINGYDSSPWTAGPPSTTAASTASGATPTGASTRWPPRRVTT